MNALITMVAVLTTVTILVVATIVLVMMDIIKEAQHVQMSKNILQIYAKLDHSLV